MLFDFASAKSLVRRTVHATFGVQAFYQDDTVNTPIETRARLHNRIGNPIGDLDGAGYAEVIEGVDHIVLIPQDVRGFPLNLKRGGTFTFPTMFPGETFELDVKRPSTGPLEVSWIVSRK
jgi:hypothetical protein